MQQVKGVKGSSNAAMEAIQGKGRGSWGSNLGL